MDTSKLTVTDRLTASRLLLEETFARASLAEYQRDQALAEVARLNKRPLLVRLGLRKEDRPAENGRPVALRPSPLKPGE